MINIKDYVKERKILLSEKILKSEKKPMLVIVQVGDNPASNSYVKGKLKDCEEVGLKALLEKLPTEISQEEFEEKIKDINNNKEVTGIIIQLPLPGHLSVNLDLIDDKKDVDGFKITSKFVPCTPLGIINFLKNNNIDFAGKNAVVIGRSDIVGKPMANLLLNENATVTICHSKTKNLSEHTKMADIIVVAAGKRNILTKDMIGNNKPIVIDVGINRNEEGKLCGDCDYENIVDLCTYVSPVPGGVGLLTRLTLIENVLNTI